MKNDSEGGLEGQQFLEDLLNDINYLFTLGLENKLRENVADSISLIKYGMKVTDSSVK